jgi:hypothetical protein
LIDSEALLDKCVAASGGVRVSSIVGAAPAFANADYWFERDSVVAELKSLQKDFLSDAAAEEKRHNLFKQWVDAGKVEPGWGSVAIRTDQIPEECARDLIGVFRNPFETGILKKANKQIRATKHFLKRPDALGLLFLANDGNSALDPEMTIHILHHALKTKFSQIDHVIYFSANFTIRLGDRPDEVLPFMNIRMGGRRPISDQFGNRLLRNWSIALNDALGETVPLVNAGEAHRSLIMQSRFRRHKP